MINFFCGILLVDHLLHHQQGVKHSSAARGAACTVRQSLPSVPPPGREACDNKGRDNSEDTALWTGDDPNHFVVVLFFFFFFFFFFLIFFSFSKSELLFLSRLTLHAPNLRNGRD
jgi:hypothetical protein